MDLDELVKNPQERLALELKAWIDPDTSQGKAKIIKACIAMRNNNSGSILIGFDDKTGQPQSCPFPEPSDKFHIDAIQGLVSKYSSEPFEIKVDYLKREGLECVVIQIPAGIKTPVATRLIMKDDKDNTLVKSDTVYVRSLNANNTPSTTEATWKDWKDLTERCFENREADIGRFVQRHLTQQNMKEVGLLLAKTQNIQENSELEKNEMRTFFQDCENKYYSALEERKPNLPPHGLMEIGVIIKGETANLHKTNKNFLNLIDSTNPRYTGWPAWPICRNASNKKSTPQVKDDAWEALILQEILNNLTFWRVYPSGKFFLLNALQYDMSKSVNAPEPLSVLDFALAILRTGEKIVVALSFAKAMGYDLEHTVVKFGFKWTKLQNRELCSWANQMRYISGGKVSHQDEFYTEIEIVLNASNTSICRNLYEIINQLFNLFGGFEIEYSVVEDLFNRLINRRL